MNTYAAGSLSRRRWVAALAAALAILTIGVTALLAHERTVFDADDSPGPLDVAAARLRDRVFEEVRSHPKTSRRVRELRLRVVMYEKWKRELLEGDENFIAVEFNLDRDKRIERCLVVTNGQEELLGRVYRGCYSRMKLITAASVSRPDKHSIRTSVDKHRLGRGIRSSRWRITTSFTDHEAGEGEPCWPGTFPGKGPYGTCRDSTKWKPHRFAASIEASQR